MLLVKDLDKDTNGVKNDERIWKGAFEAPRANVREKSAQQDAKPNTAKNPAKEQIESMTMTKTLSDFTQVEKIG